MYFLIILESCCLPGIMECWNNGIMIKKAEFTCDAIQTQYSSIPQFHHSMGVSATLYVFIAQRLIFCQ